MKLCTGNQVLSSEEITQKGELKGGLELGGGLELDFSQGLLPRGGQIEWPSGCKF